MGVWVNGGGSLINFPLIKEAAPIVSRKWPEDWAACPTRSNKCVAFQQWTGCHFSEERARMFGMLFKPTRDGRGKRVAQKATSDAS